MDRPNDSAAAETRPSMSPDVRISVTNFGPIAEGTIDLRPLTVFVGPSNTGKTYLAVLIYALYRVLGGLPRVPVMHRHRYAFGQAPRPDQLTDEAVQQEELRDVLEKMSNSEQAFRFCDLPESMRGVAQVELNDPDRLAAGLEAELRRCFDLESISDLVRFSGRSDGLQVSLAVSEESQALWRFCMGVSQTGITANGQITEGMVLLPEGWSHQKEWRPSFLPSHWSLPEALWFKANVASDQGETHYLPAARGGIMQSHRVIANSLVIRSTMAGVERVEIPTFSGVMADFMGRLILYRGERKRQNPLREIADAFEREVLAGRIEIRRFSASGYPEFVYQPQETEEDIRLSRASSMVSELAPVVLFLRGAIGRGDTFIIEEPEAHLHPAAQTQMAVALARLVRAGVRVVVTTHSDWLLQEIGNLIREGELEEQTGEPVSDGYLPSSLRPSEVGIWLFRRDEGSASSVVKEIPFDRSEGIGPEEYEDVADELYNRSANLQNRLEEIAGDAERDDE